MMDELFLGLIMRTGTIGRMTLSSAAKDLLTAAASQMVGLIGAVADAAAVAAALALAPDG